MKKNTLTLLIALFTIGISYAQVSTEGVDDLITTMEFEETTFDFGTIVSGEKVSFFAEFKNTGDKPLVIKAAKGSCGCTIPKWPKEPIMPGATSQMLIEFNSKGKHGKTSKRVTITANTEPAQTFLTITGMIEKDEVAIPTKKEGSLAITPNDIPKTNINKLPLAKDCFAIFPNPTSDILKLELKEYLGKSANIRIFSATGETKEVKKVDKISGSLMEFQVSDYPTGTYYVNIRIEKDVVATKCFVVTK